MLKLTKVSTGYGSNQVLRQVSLEVSQGSVLALIGPNGSGKTTLIRAASGVLELQEGSIEVRGRDIAHLTNQERARLIAVVPQSRSLPPAFTVREVVALGRTPHLNWLGKLSATDEAIIDKAMEHMDMLNLAERNISELSGGEQQRLFLARALAQEAPLVMMDEPTTHLDLQYQVNLMQRIRGIAHPSSGELAAGIQPRTVVVAIHDVNLVSGYVDLVALLINGRLEALAPPLEVLKPDVLSRAYQMPLRTLHDVESGQTVVIPAVEPMSYNLKSASVR